MPAVLYLVRTALVSRCPIQPRWVSSILFWLWHLKLTWLLVWTKFSNGHMFYGQKFANDATKNSLFNAPHIFSNPCKSCNSCNLQWDVFIGERSSWVGGADECGEDWQRGIRSAWTGGAHIWPEGACAQLPHSHSCGGSRVQVSTFKLTKYWTGCSLVGQNCSLSLHCETGQGLKPLH